MAAATYDQEHRVAMLAAQRASILTRRVFQETSKGTLSKDDQSPVTIGDFGAQALIISALKHNFPDDDIVAEEDSGTLREGDNTPVCNRIWELVQTTHLDNDQAEQELGGAIKNRDAMLDLLDMGQSPGGSSGRIWTIDPIDGTKGFLRGGQYAVCVGLIVDGEVRVGVLACPNLPVDDATPLESGIGSELPNSEHSGVLFSAISGRGATSRPLTHGDVATARAISMKKVEDIAGASMCESFEAAHSNHSQQSRIAQQLGIVKPSVRMDSQAKYGSIARGAGDIYLRLPTRKDYREKIWDHAPGEVIVREAGGVVTDVEGKSLNFGLGRTLDGNTGVIAAPVNLHGKVLQVVQGILGEHGN